MGPLTLHLVERVLAAARTTGLERARSALSVGCLRAVFAQVVVFRNVAGNASLRRTQKNAAECQAGDVFEHVSVFDSLRWVRTPGKRGGASHQHPRNSHRIEFAGTEAANDNRAGVPNVARGNFFGRKWFSNRNRTVKVVSVGG